MNKSAIERVTEGEVFFLHSIDSLPTSESPWSGTGAFFGVSDLNALFIQDERGNALYMPTLKTNQVVAPAVTDDITKGFIAGSFWTDTTADQVYVCLRSHAGWEPGHIHFVLQPAWNRLKEEYPGPGPILQMAYFAGSAPPRSDIEQMATHARKYLQQLA